MSEPARPDRPAAASAARPSEAPSRAGAAAPSEPPQPKAERAERAVLDFADPLSRQSPDDTDSGWGERPASSAGDLARFLDERPPHHI